MKAVPGVELGQACTASTDCANDLLCMTVPTGRVCVQSCQDASECGQAGAQCSSVAGVDVGFCDTAPDAQGDTPRIEPPMDDTPMDDTPMDDTPMDDTPMDDTPMDDPPVNDPPEDDPPVGNSTDRTTYPEGPFGTMLGDVIANHSLIDANGEPITLGDLRADPSVQLLLIFNTVTYCRGCQAKTAELTELHNTLGSQGLLPIVSLYENNQYEPAVGEDALNYQRLLDLGFPVIADSRSKFQRYFAERGHPMILIIDADDMTILYKKVHWRRDEVDAAIQQFYSE